MTKIDGTIILTDVDVNFNNVCGVILAQVQQPNRIEYYITDLLRTPNLLLTTEEWNLPRQIHQLVTYKTQGKRA